MNNKNENLINKAIIALNNVKEKIPLTHCITNYVTINDCANAILAIGGSPVMADDSEEVKEIVEIADTLVINIGEVSEGQIKAMNIACDYATKTNTPIILDPVAVGVTNLRNDLVLNLIENSNLSVIRGNMSEIKAIAKLINISKVKSNKDTNPIERTTSEYSLKNSNIVDNRDNISSGKGVDVSKDDEVTFENLKDNGKLVKALAKEINTVIIASGAIDIISDGNEIYACENGDPLMPKITGSGCMLSSIVGTFCGVNDPLIGGIAATLVMGISGEIAGNFVKNEQSGTGTFRSKLIDYLYNLDKDELLNESKIYKVEI